MTAQFVTVSTACTLLGCSAASIRRWHRDGRLPNTKRSPGGHRWFLLADLQQLVNGATK